MSGGLAARMKGQRYERELAALINERLGLACRRGFQSRGGAEAADIEGFIPGFHLEAKRQERTNIWRFMRQAEEDAKEGEIPVVVTRRSREPSLAVLWFEDFLELIAQAYGLGGGGRGG